MHVKPLINKRIVKYKGFCTIFIWITIVFVYGSAKAKQVPIRIDVHAGAGYAYPMYGYLSELFPWTVFVDFDGKALIDKKDIKHRIPKKYQKFAADEIYAGHMLIPTGFAFSVNSDSSAWDFYVDWSIIGLKLLNIPPKRTFRAPVNLRVNASVVLAYHLLKNGSTYFHSPRPGLQVKAESMMHLVKPLSLKLFAFQKGFVPDMRDGFVPGEKTNIMPNYGAVGASFVIHIFTSRNM